MQDVLEVAVGKYLLSINVAEMQQAAPKGGFMLEQPVVCHVENPIEGVHVLGAHHDNVTDLAVPSFPSFRVASASQDGTVKVSLSSHLNSNCSIGQAVSMELHLLMSGTASCS